jgi:malate dehydrogenase (oxaloacetate-decarboxylating)
VKGEEIVKAMKEPAKKANSHQAATKITKPVNTDELLAKAKIPGQHAMKLHPFYRGKIEIVPKCVVRDFTDFAIWYTPGVAEPCKAIKADPKQVWQHTNKWNTVAVVTDGTRVLGLGDIGPEAGLPVMEGKSLLFKYLGGVDSFPVCLDTKNPDEIIQIVKWIQPSFGGINLEDISQPKCFYILDRLRKEARIPVWHDDQQGTATVVVAGALNAIKLVGKKPSEAKVAMIGAGASNIAGLRVMIAAGFNPKNIIMTDSKSTLSTSRKDLQQDFKEKWWAAQITNAEGRQGGVADAMKGADLTIAASKPGPGTIKPEWVKMMADDAIIFPIANPVPEIWPWEAHEAGARIVATGRSDFPNQVNNSLGFPGIFRGVLDVSASTITDEMCIAAAKELAKTAEDNGLREDYIVPTMDEWEVYPREATAVALKAIEQGVAGVKKSRPEIYEDAERIIKRARAETKFLMDGKFIPQAPP